MAAVDELPGVAAEWLALRSAARRVVSNVHGATPRHTRARGGGCRDDCVPSGLDALRDALAVWSEETTT